MSNQELYILGSKINDLSIDQVINKIDQFLQSDKKGYIVTPNPEICLKAYQDKFLRRIIKASWLSIPDGFGLKIGALIFGQHLKNTTTGIDLTKQLLSFCEQNNYSVLFFEGQPAMAKRARKVIKEKHLNLKINFLNPGKVGDRGQTENQNLNNQINQIASDIIFVNLGCPKQEYFIQQNIAKLNTKLMLGIGGSFDFISGRLKRAPQILQKLGLEWLYRLYQEPSRWPRIFKAVIIFPLACLKFKLGSWFIYRKNVAAFIINDKKEILIAKHAKYNYWQLPQGGAKNSKTKQDYEQAVLREVKQEIGTDQVKIIDWAPNCYKYKWPEMKDKLWDHFKGQRQTLFLLKFQGKDDDIKLDPHEFKDWQWVKKDDILNKVKDFKKPLIKIALQKFNKYL